MYEIAIVGAGPAGATLARLIGQQYRVLLIDKRALADSSRGFPAGKCCGGLLAPDAQRMVSRMGLGLPRDVLEEPQLFVVKAIDLQQRLERYYPRHYINLNRQKFESWLLSLVPSSIEVRTGCRLESYSSESECFKLTLVQNDRTFVERSRILVGADGAISRLRSQSSSGHPAPKRYFGIQEWVEAERKLPHFTALFDPEITDYYCWTIPKGDYLLIGAALDPKDNVSDKFGLLKEKLRGCGVQFGRTVWREGAFLLRPVKTKQLSTGDRGIALLGEAAGWISPSSAEGLSYAFRSALTLAECLQVTPDGFERRYHQKTRRLRRNILLKSLKSHFLFDPILRRAIMRSGLRSVRVDLPAP